MLCCRKKNYFTEETRKVDKKVLKRWKITLCWRFCAYWEVERAVWMNNSRETCFSAKRRFLELPDKTRIKSSSDETQCYSLVSRVKLKALKSYRNFVPRSNKCLLLKWGFRNSWANFRDNVCFRRSEPDQHISNWISIFRMFHQA